MIQYLTFDAGGTQLHDFATLALGPSQISMGPDGNLYVLSVMLGKLFRIRYEGDGTTVASGNPRPVSSATAAPTADARWGSKGNCRRSGR